MGFGNLRTGLCSTIEGSVDVSVYIMSSKPKTLTLVKSSGENYERELDQKILITNERRGIISRVVLNP